MSTIISLSWGTDERNRRCYIEMPGVHTVESTEMPTDSCQFFYECNHCHAVLRLQPGDCCVFCSYADVKCPSMQVI